MSGVYINGMEMPTECGRCNAAFPNGVDYSCCLIKGYPLISSQRSTRLKNCPLVPVPPHGNLIERKAICLTDFEIAMCDGDYKEGMKMLLEKIESAPTVIPADENE